ncbi:MAG: hypothetical protein HZB18_12275 [Chloroflexi bacterium]|nr:hypothetical protein [Chloroflexota bacterium]
MNTFKEYILPAIVYILIAAALIFAMQFLAQTGWAAGVRETAANTPSEVGAAPATIIEFLTSLAIATVRMTLLIGIPFAITSTILKRTQRPQPAAPLS